MFQTIELRFEGPIASVILNRPEVRNAFDARMIAELTEVFTSLSAVNEVRAVVLSGAGPVFSGGADVSWMRDTLNFTMEQNIEDAERMSTMFATINRVTKPVIGQVHGAALGGGMGLLSVCDIVVAAEDATFGFTETKLGLIPAVISTYVLPKIGSSWARALFFTGERFDARLAQTIGLAHWVVPAGELDEAVDRRIRHLLSSGPSAVTEAKRLIFDMENSERQQRARLTAERIAGLRVSEEGQEGLRAFLEKRSPRWHATND